MCQICSIKFISGDWLGHQSFCMPFSWCQACIIFAEWQGAPSSMKRWWFLSTWALAKIGRRPSLSISMYYGRIYVTFTHTTSVRLSIMPNCTPNHYRKVTMFNCWLQSDSSKILDQVISTPIHNHCMRIGQMRTHQRRSQLAKSPVVSWSSPWPTCISWLSWLVGEVACVLLCYLCTQVFQGIFWLMTHSTMQFLWYISGWDSRFPLHWSLKASEISCWWPRMTRMGFYSLLGFVLELGDDMVHSGQWNGQIPRSLLLTCISLFPVSSWSTILPLWKSVSSKEPSNWGMLIHSVVHYSAIYSIF